MKKKLPNSPKKLKPTQAGWRWVVLPGWRRLHRVAKLDVNDIQKRGELFGIGETLCGRKGELRIPGILSRMGLPRCHHCCRMVKMPDGLGNPRNDKKLRKIATR